MQRVLLGTAIIALSVVAFVPLPLWLVVALIGGALFCALAGIFVGPRPPQP